MIAEDPNVEDAHRPPELHHVLRHACFPRRRRTCRCISDAVIFLASDLSRAVTTATQLTVDMGATKV